MMGESKPTWDGLLEERNRLLGRVAELEAALGSALHVLMNRGTAFDRRTSVQYEGLAVATEADVRGALGLSEP